MVDFETFLKFIKAQDYYTDQIFHVEHIPESKAQFEDLKKPIRKRLQRWLDNNNIRLWRHQAEAINSIRNRKNTATVTSTASGKSLCYNIPVIESILEDPTTTALYLFPTKALARDQFEILSKLLEETNIKQTRIGVYDGDVEPQVKRQILANANIIITNPFGLHFYLPWFRKKWIRICKNLKYIVLDEIHTYRGIFGSNFALLIRRLKRILEIYNVRPVWILSSATIHNAKAFCEKLVGEDFTVVDKDYSPSGGKKVILWDLPYDNVSKKYRSAHQETKNLFISHLKKNIQTLTFTLSRKMAELQAIWTKTALPSKEDKIFSYRAGISKKKRREIEQNFKNRKILGISSTNALELGIDIGSLDATISSGFPGTISSFKQQIGRSGRGTELSISTLIPMQNPLDLFYIHNPSQLFGPIQEEILITLENKYLLRNHLCCASKEIPLKIGEYQNFGLHDVNLFNECLGELVSENLLMKRGDKYYWKSDFFPHKKYGLNDLSNRSYKVILRTDQNEIFLTVEDESFVFRDLHLGAIYLYEAQTYLVEELDLDEKLVFLRKANVDFYTQSLRHTDITPLETLLEKKIGISKNIEVFYGNVKVEHEYYSYKVVDTKTQETRSRHPLEDIPLIKFETQAVFFLIPFKYQKELELEGYLIGDCIHATEHVMIAMAPAIAQISRWDLGGVSIDFDPVRQQPIIYIYDGYRGGIGISELLYQKLNELLILAFNLLNSCKCKEGCACCIYSPKCGNQNQHLNKKGALELIKKLLNKSQESDS